MPITDQGRHCVVAGAGAHGDGLAGVGVVPVRRHDIGGGVEADLVPAQIQGGGVALFAQHPGCCAASYTMLATLAPSVVTSVR